MSILGAFPAARRPCLNPSATNSASPASQHLPNPEPAAFQHTAVQKRHPEPLVLDEIPKSERGRGSWLHSINSRAVFLRAVHTDASRDRILKLPRSKASL